MLSCPSQGSQSCRCSFEAMGKPLGKPAGVFKRPAGMLKRPAGAEPPSKKSKKDEEPEEEEPEEEEGQEDKEEEEKTEEEEEEKLPLTKKALEDHQKFLEESGNLSDKQFDKALSKLSPGQQQSLWKKFEHSRKSQQMQGEYQKETVGAGSLARKKKLLRSWCLDGGKCDKCYKKAFATITLDKSSGLEKEWYSKKKMEDEIGVEEMKVRLKAGTLKYRKNPEDPRFYQFQKLSEKEATWLTKTKQARKEVVADGTKEEAIKFDKLMLEDLTEQDFDLEYGGSESEGDELDKDLAKAMGIQGDKEKEKKKKEDKWAKMSQVSDTDTQNKVSEKLVAFKTEVTKDLAALEALCFTLKDHGGDKALLKDIAQSQKKGSGILDSLKKRQAKKGAKDYLVDTLAKACTYLKELKSLKVRTKKALKA